MRRIRRNRSAFRAAVWCGAEVVTTGWAVADSPAAGGGEVAVGLAGGEQAGEEVGEAEEPQAAGGAEGDADGHGGGAGRGDDGHPMKLPAGAAYQDAELGVDAALDFSRRARASGEGSIGRKA